MTQIKTFPFLTPMAIVSPNGLPSTQFQTWINNAFASIIDALNAAQVAQTAADAANAAAAAAQASATAAEAAIADISADNKLTPVEKKRVVIPDHDVIISEQSDIDAKATSYGITTEKTAYDNAVSALTTYLATLTTPVLWTDLSGETDIVGATFRSNFEAVYTTKQTLMNKIAAVAGTQANWSGVSNDNGNLPENKATYSRVYVQTTAPTSPTTNDVWVNISTTPFTVEVWNGSVWTVGANDTTNTNQLTDGANLGGTATWTGVTGTGKPQDNATLGADWGTNLTTRPIELTDGRVSAALNSSGRFRTGTNFFPAAIIGIRNTNNVTITATDAGTSATISISSSVRKLPGESSQITISYSSGTLTGKVYSTTYYIYADDPSFAGGAVTYVATTDTDDLCALTGRVYFGSVTTPASGSGTGTTGGGGGFGGGVSGGGGGGAIP